MKKTQPMSRTASVAALLALAFLLSVSPVAAEEKTVTGTVRDPYCLLKMGAKGEKHRKCAIECAKSGINLIIEEEGTGKLYPVLPDKDKSDPSEKLVEHAERKVKVTGSVETLGGVSYITAERVESAE